MSSSAPVRPWAVRSRWFERTLVACGVMLLAFAGGARLLGEMQKRQALARFDTALRSVPPAKSAPGLVRVGGVDTSLWSPGRIKAWRESLQQEFGAPTAVLSIPKIGLEVPVLEGTDDLTLNRAVGLVEGTPHPDAGGNSCIAGHRDGFFRGLKDIAAGDVIEVRTLAARHTYVVESTRVIEPSELEVLDDTPAPVLTLVTCYPFYFVGSAPQRFIVRAVRRSTVPAS